MAARTDADLALRDWREADRAACLALFDGNTPDFFDPGERDDFVSWLDSVAAGDHPCRVIVHPRAGVVACGGIYRDGHEASAALSWGMVARDWQRRGLGRMLLRDRIALARTLPGLHCLTLTTSQHSRAFYQAEGFVLRRILPGGIAPGLDGCDMVFQL